MEGQGQEYPKQYTVIEGCISIYSAFFSVPVSD